MRCLEPRNVGFRPDGKTLAWSVKNCDKQFAYFKIPCGKCIECRLEYARQWAIRCVHESKMHPHNSFITLTYTDKNLTSTKLQYNHYQLFIKKLRYLIFSDTNKNNFKNLNYNQLSTKQKQQHLKEYKNLYDSTRIGFFVTGEYGESKKRPHWHAIIFNWRPSDAQTKYKNSRGDQVYSSKILDGLWSKGIAEFGSVTFESAGYCARYAAKKLVHGNDQDHDFHPISKKSSKHAIGKTWIAKYWPDVFNYGEVVLDGGQKCGIPRYYEKWLQKNEPEEWLRYIREVKSEKCAEMESRRLKEEQEEKNANNQRDYWLEGPQIKKSKVKSVIIQEKFKRLQSCQKGDI